MNPMNRTSQQLLRLHESGIVSIFLYEPHPPLAILKVALSCSSFLKAKAVTLWENTSGREIFPIQPLVGKSHADAKKLLGSNYSHLLKRSPKNAKAKIKYIPSPRDVEYKKHKESVYDLKNNSPFGKTSGSSVSQGKNSTVILRIPFSEKREYDIVFSFEKVDKTIEDIECQRELRSVGDVLQDVLVNSLKRHIGKTRAGRGEFSLVDFFYEGKKTAAYLFADIRGFSVIYDALKSTRADMHFRADRDRLPDIATILDDFYKAMGIVVFRYGRFVRSLGDGLFAIMGDSDPACRKDKVKLMSKEGLKYGKKACITALACAIDMQYAFNKLVERQWENWISILRRFQIESLRPQLGIGIGFGEGEFGLYGIDEYEEYSADGHHLNYAKRLEEKAGKPYETIDIVENILVSQPVISGVSSVEVDGSMVRRMVVNLRGGTGKQEVYGIRPGSKQKPYIDFWRLLVAKGKTVGVSLSETPEDRTD